MDKIFINLIKAIWPFLRESWFQGDSLGTWIRKHKVIVTWLVLVITLCISDLVLLRELSTLKLSYHDLSGRHTVVKHENTLLKKQLMEEKKRSKELESYQLQANHMATWLEHCSFTGSYTTNTCPAPVIEYVTTPCKQQTCKPRATAKPKPRKPNNSQLPLPPEEPEEKPKETFRQKMKRIFSGKGSST